jgi:hypothetical protein
MNVDEYAKNNAHRLQNQMPRTAAANPFFKTSNNSSIPENIKE